MLQTMAEKEQLSASEYLRLLLRRDFEKIEVTTPKKVRRHA